MDDHDSDDSGKDQLATDTETIDVGSLHPKAGPDDLRQFMFRDAFGELDGTWEWSPSAAIARALEFGLTVVERRWGYAGERVFYEAQAPRPRRVAGVHDEDFA
jgi:hypothetical protein